MLRTLLEDKLAARDASNTANRLKAAGVPVRKTTETFDLAASSIPPAPFYYKPGRRITGPGDGAFIRRSRWRFCPAR